MQGKGLIKGFLILLAIVTALQFLYMVPTRKVESDATAYGKMIAEKSTSTADKYVIEKAARISYLDSMSSEDILTIPMIKSYTYDDLKKQQLALGLDLKGGMSLFVQVDLEELLKALSNNSKDPTFLTALENAKTAQLNSQDDFVSLFVDAFSKISNGKKLASIFLRNEGMRDEINTKSSNIEVAKILRLKADETVKLTYNRLKQRIDKLGVAQPNISLDEARDLILVELPGIENPDRARGMVVDQAKLEFWDTYEITDAGISASFIEADKKLKTSLGIVEDVVTTYDSSYTYKYDDLGNVIDSTLAINEVAEDAFANAGPLLKILNLNGAGGSLQYYTTVMGGVDRNKKDLVDSYLSRSDIKALFPRNSKFLWSQKPHVDFESNEATRQYELYMVKTLSGTEKAPMEGNVIINASQSPDPTTGEPTVSLTMNARGAKKWADMTTKAANPTGGGDNRKIAIALDDQVVSSPRVSNPITGGRSSISGNFTVQEASDLSSILEVGKLPAKLKIIQESTVGPSLGEKNIKSSMFALIAGFLIVLIFMAFYYGGAGLVAVVALLVNLFFIFGALASIGTVLTLPGIAGIILTIGMSVDANVIIFERIREELRAGKGKFKAIADGFKHSYSAIIDANVTTLLVAFVLSYFGLGPIKGFAVVLIIGVLSSLLTAVVMGRMLIEWHTGKGKNLNFWTNTSKGWFSKMEIDWIGKRKIGYIVSSTLIIIGLASIFTKQFDLGVDFKGGYSYNVEFPTDMDIDPQTLRKGLTEYFGTAPVVKAVDVANTYNIVTSHLINDQSDGASKKVVETMLEGLNKITGQSITYDQFTNSDVSNKLAHITSSSKVGATIADDIKKSSTYAGGFALLFIFLYILFRFDKWQYSLGAVAALLHDSLIVLGLFSLLHGIVPWSLEIDQAFVAALLTVIGYSINDTVVIFDRIREFFGIYHDKPSDEVFNLAINSTFSRTIVTSLTTLIVVALLFIFGGSTIKGFAFALLIGIIVGTYSSIFVATPLVRDLSKNMREKK